MRNKFWLFAVALLMIGFASAVEVNLTHSSSSIVQIRSLKYEPYPVNPGEYFDMWISVTFLRNPRLDVQFELNPSYPFSLDSNESVLVSYPAGSVPSSVLLKYKVRVDKNAVEGTNKLTLVYKFEGVYYTQNFEIEVANAQTDFDAVLQDSTVSEVSIAIANTGKNTANSVIVKIPEQDNFESTGTSGQMIGNLESGDYSIVSFEISKKINIPSEPLEGGEKNFQMPSKSSQSENLSFDIYYTDNIGVRRVVNMQLPVSMSNSNMSAMMGGFDRRGDNAFPWYIPVIAISVLLIVLFVIYKKVPKSRKFFSKLNPKNWFKKKESKSEIPDWVKRTKEREKTK